ncbi:MAG: TolC family protein [Sphingomonadales bacterium]|nr:TolC family protein [Sphingomonadales bacterium]
MLMRGLTLSLLLMSAMTGCASYAPDPLRDPSAVLSSANTVTIDAQRIDRPFLHPQSIDLSQPLTLNALAVITVLENPDLKAQRAKEGITDAQAFSARLLPDPAFTGNFDKVLSGPDPFNGFGGSIGFDLNQLRTAKTVRQAGNATKQQVRLDLAWAEWQTAGAARLQGVRIISLEHQLAIARANATNADYMFQTSARAAGRGDLAAADVDSRRLAALDAASGLRTTENELTMARGELNKQLGLAPDVQIRLAPLPDAIVPPSAEILVTLALTRRLDLSALRAGYAASEADLHKAVLDQFPNFSLTLAAARDTANNYTLGPSVGFTLPFFNRNRGGIAVASATREQMRAEYEARLFQTRADITAAVNGIATVHRQRAALIAAMPALEQYAAATSRAVRRGDLAPATASAAEQALRDRKLTLLQLDQQTAEQTVALELLTGGPSEGWTQ